MNFSCTQKVIKSLGELKQIEELKEEPNHFNWYLDLMRLRRRQYFNFTHSTTLFTFWVYVGTKVEKQNLELIFTRYLEEQLIRDIGTTRKYNFGALIDGKELRYTKTNSRKILGCVNDYKRITKHCIEDLGESRLAVVQINNQLNNMPMGSIGYNIPKEAMRQYLEGN